MAMKYCLEEMEIPVINLEEIEGERKSKTMSLLHEACKKWGFFWVSRIEMGVFVFYFMFAQSFGDNFAWMTLWQLENHGIDKGLMDKIKGLVNQHYEESMKESFYSSDLAKELGCHIKASDVDWESSFFYRHQPDSNINDIPELLREVMQEYVAQLIKLAEKLAELLSENLGLEKDYLKKAFSEPFVGTKVAKYPECSQPELVMGLRGHTDAGGIILLLQDDKVPGLEFLKDGEWVPIPPTKGYRIFVNLGDQVEVMSNGIYRSVQHQVLANKNGSRLSIVTSYNPGGNAIISPAPKLVYPSCYRFQDYLNYYSTTKFSDKLARFQTMKEMLEPSQ